jgi:hypothetical protein
MKLLHARLRAPNFGDDLNLWLWPKLLPGVFDDDESIVFYGIGSIISHRSDGPAKKIVLGAAFVPEYGRLPDLAGDRWQFYFVRGPVTAAALGLDPALGIGDPAVLVRTVLPPGKRDGPVCFMPHWESLEWGYWQAVCQRAGLSLIDPRWPVERVLDAIGSARLMICEAMHGAIVADALQFRGFPWSLWSRAIERNGRTGRARSTSP